MKVELDIDPGTVVSCIWRSDNNIGCQFVKDGKHLDWNSMSLDEREKCAYDMGHMGQFFMRLVMSDNADDDTRIGKDEDK